MKKFKLNNNLIVSKADLSQYETLPDNIPGNSLTKKQIDFVNDMYYRHITRFVDRQAYGLPLFELETKERWPSGPKVKSHEAKRFVLEQLIQINKRKSMTAMEAANYFLTWLDGREYMQKLLKYAYTA